MAELPIIFSAPMVRAILEGRKGQTRRIIKPPRWSNGELELGADGVYSIAKKTGCLSKVRLAYSAGDTVWVKEEHRTNPSGIDADGTIGVYYRADNSLKYGLRPSEKWKQPKSALRGCTPSIHMPRWASRIMLKVEAVRVEHLQDISEADARGEGLVPYQVEGPGGITCTAWHWVSGIPEEGSLFTSAHHAFRHLWQSLHGLGSWEENPLVAIYDFRTVA